MSEKRKRKHTPKPIKMYLSPIRHMVGWGMLTGYVLVLLVFVIGSLIEGYRAPVGIAIVSFLLLSAIMGSLPGAFLGMLYGVVLNMFVVDLTRPNEKEAMRQAQKRALPVLFFVSSGSVFLLGSWLFPAILELSDTFLWLFITGFAISSGIAMTCASYHYFHRLYRWSVKAYGEAEKPKRDSESGSNRLASDNYSEALSDTMFIDDTESKAKADHQ